MPNCPKCRADVPQDAAFCPKCGAAMKPTEGEDWRQEMRQKRTEWREQRRQWREERRTARRGEWEKTEKNGSPFVGIFITGAILVLLGVLAFFAATSTISSDLAAAYFFITVGIIVVALAVYAAFLAAKRHPKT